jgi:periplasmic protein TonB
MPSTRPAEPEAFSLDEVARAAGVPGAHVDALLAAGGIQPGPGGYLLFEEAVRLVRAAHGLDWRASRPGLFAAAPVLRPQRRMPLVVSGVLHALVLLVVAAATGTAGRTAAPAHEAQEPARLVFLVSPGPGGGGGGGGQRQSLPPPAAQLKGRRAVRSPVAVARTVDPRHLERPIAAALPAEPTPASSRDPEPPAPPAPAPPVAAPVASIAGDDTDRAGVLNDADELPASRGPGDEGGVGSGRGTGTGAGEGAGIGDGSGGGTGGGPYRPGSGITPPSLEREVKPTYTEEARRRGVEGDVLLEVVVRSDGTVGSMRVVRSLGAGLDERAIEAVRQWRFSPAHRLGTPVDVLVEVAVTFRLR